MKIVTFVLLYLFTSLVFANQPGHVGDTLVVNTQFGTTTYSGDMTQFDTEDTIAQIEVNNATIVFTPLDTIFLNGFELYNVNWIWVGDDTNDVEFGGAGDCKLVSNWSTWPGNNRLVVLDCYQIQDEANRVTP